MTRAAERLRELVRTETTRIEDLRLIKLLFLHRDEMFLAWSMTRFAFHARSQSIELQLHPVNRARRVATKALLRLIADNRASQRILKRCRHGCPVTNREIELAKFLEVADPRLIKNIVVTEDVSLPDMALAKAIKDGLRDAVGAVRNRVRNVLALPREFVRVVAILKCQPTACSQDFTIRRDLQSLAHRR